MGIVRIALRFPHTFYVLAALIVFLGVTAIRAMAPRPITRHPAAHQCFERSGRLDAGDEYAGLVAAIDAELATETNRSSAAR